jgi:hypothetical protein
MNVVFKLAGHTRWHGLQHWHGGVADADTAGCSEHGDHCQLVGPGVLESGSSLGHSLQVMAVTPQAKAHDEHDGAHVKTFSSLIKFSKAAAMHDDHQLSRSALANSFQPC